MSIDLPRSWLCCQSEYGAPAYRDRKWLSHGSCRFWAKMFVMSSQYLTTLRMKKEMNYITNVGLLVQTHIYLKPELDGILGIPYPALHPVSHLFTIFTLGYPINFGTLHSQQRLCILNCGLGVLVIGKHLLKNLFTT